MILSIEGVELRFFFQPHAGISMGVLEYIVPACCAAEAFLFLLTALTGEVLEMAVIVGAVDVPVCWGFAVHAL